MRIATWNLERPTALARKNHDVIHYLKRLDADILVLTESNDCIDLGGEYNCFHSDVLPSPYYKNGERRSSIYAKYKLVRAYATFRGDTSICCEFETGYGNLIVYATVIGIFGNRRKDFVEDLQRQAEDWRKLKETGVSLCIAGDYNVSFGDNYYYTKYGRDYLNNAFGSLSIQNLTSEIPENIDHIAISEKFVDDRKILATTWNERKLWSDHIGVCIDIM